MKNLSLDIENEMVIDQYGREVSVEAVKMMFNRNIRFTCQVTILRLKEYGYDLEKTIEFYRS